MARLYIFAIGGTGSRVLKSLTMLVASGIKPHTSREYELVPIIIDPHKANEDLKRTIRMLDSYQAITDEIGFSNGFFSTKVATPDKLVDSGNKFSQSFTFNLQQVSNTKFKDYIDYNLLDEPNQSLIDLLFSGKSINKRGEEVDLLDIEMDIGFVGNPNVGSVVLNQFKDSVEFKEMASNFNEEDRIFIISSIFGGTGAAGFPIVLKNIRNARNNLQIDGVGFLENAKIGAITVLPYFNIEKDTTSPIQKSDFISKTKSALHYYKDNVTGNNSVNALYYIADDHFGKAYKNDPGDNGQKNEAHFIELAAALSIIDFLEIPDRQLQCVNGAAVSPVYKEFGIKNNAEVVKFSDFEDRTERQLSLALSQFTLFKKFIDEDLRSAIEKQSWSNDEPSIDARFLDSPFFRSYLMEFMEMYDEWLVELETNRRSFAPFNRKSSVHSFVKDVQVRSGMFSKNVDFTYLNGKLSKISKGKKYPSANHKFIHLFYETTRDVLTNKFGLKN
ncbi:MAG: hypothetical protein ACNS62_11960 [Candidatus Cyclobacteriaceae bacterium M3_2C_046]